MSKFIKKNKKIEEIKEKYSSIKTIEIDNSKDIEEVKKILKEFINF